MMSEPHLAPTLQKYVDFIAAAGRPVGFAEVIEACSPHQNYFRHLKRRGLIKNVVPDYKKDEPYTGPRLPKYVLTEAGLRLVSGSANANPSPQPENRSQPDERRDAVT